ncbi:proteasome (prosome macropain) assembly chaperone 4 [Mactra antiquata]
MDGVKVLEPELSVHTFNDKILDTDVYFHVIKLQNSFYLWFGKSGSFGELSVAMTTLKNTLTSATSLVGSSDSHSVAMATRISKKTGKQVFIGGEVKAFDQLQLPLVEKRIAEEIKNCPDKF